MSLNLIIKRTEFFKPAIASTSRAISTIIDSTTTTSSNLTDSLPIHSLIPSIPSTKSNRTPLPTTASPTPYHPYVHLPLLSFTPIKLRAELDPSFTLPSTPLILPLPSHLFNTPARPTLLHKLIVSHLASLRTGNASTKNRSEVNYSGHKLRPQKGTGKARLGSRGSPMLRGGGRSFGPRTKGPDGWNRKVNRKEEVLGLRVCLSEKWRRGDLVIVDKVGMEEIATRRLSVRMGSRGWSDSLVLLPSISESLTEGGDRFNFIRSAGNLPEVAVCSEVSKLGVWDIVKRRKMIIDLATLDDLIARLDPDWEDVEEVENEEDGDDLLDFEE